ncbi:hypothetical protein [Aneurinibacillus tyrosinisolvens]|uniref:hypothetical protein n=1 Tax=Aneurinibacillus tyrosinisolvens TaxID=1443435 RepID=UPI00063FA506|nr:hypothetical protein [Aneurinibacillus tyrosinisolvens]
MQISDGMRGSSRLQGLNKIDDMSPGQSVNASIKQKSGPNEALVEINGQEYRAAFEKGVPRGEKVAVQVTGKSGDTLQLREIQTVDGKAGESPSPDVQVEKLLRDAGVKVTAEMKEAVRRLVAERLPVSKETLQSVQHIMQKGEGNIQQKLDVLSVMARKNISITPSGYEAVFRVKYGPPLDKILNELAKEAPDLLPAESKADPARTTQSVPVQKSFSERLQKLADLMLTIRTSGKVSRAQMGQLQEAVEKVMQEAKVSPSLATDVHELTNRLVKDLRMSLSYEAVGRNTEAKAIVERSMDTLTKLFKLPVADITASRAAASLTRAVPGMDASEENGPVFLRPVSETFLRLGSLVELARQEFITALGSVQEGEQHSALFNIPRPSEQIVQELAHSLRSAAVREALPHEEKRKMEHMLQQLEQTVQTPDSGQKDQAILGGLDQLEQLLTQSGERIAALTSVQTASFEKVSQYIPDYLREVGNEFKQIKKEVMNNVDRMSQFLQQKVPQAPSYVQRIIEPTIEMVNRLVTKGEFALFADMEFEHDVLRISSELHNVKGLLEKGKQGEALEVFRGIRADLEKLNWQPSYMKVERFFSKMTGEGTMQNPLQTYGQEWREGSLTGRGMQDWIKGTGLNHERETLDWLARREGREDGIYRPTFSHQGSDARNQQESPPHNLKSMLMEGLDGNVSPRAREMMEQALSHVTGQQLLSKQDNGSQMQSLQLQLPLPWEEGTQAVHLHVNSRSQGEQMDWENCNLFFFLDTPKFGETGVSVTIVNREVALRVQNDDSTIEKAFAPYIPQLKEQLQGLGYRIGNVAFEPATRTNQMEEMETLPTVDTSVARMNAARYTAKEGVDYSV